MCQFKTKTALKKRAVFGPPKTLIYEKYNARSNRSFMNRYNILQQPITVITFASHILLTGMYKMTKTRNGRKSGIKNRYCYSGYELQYILRNRRANGEISLKCAFKKVMAR